jgi:CubicO group peptidase (beta-lactamase class C family)
MSYEQFLRGEVIGELGLSSTGYTSVYDRARSLRSDRGEPIDVASWGGAEPFWNLVGNGGLVSTVVDMVQLRLAVTAGRVISAQTLALVQTAHVAEDSDGTSFYGYGEVVQDVEGIGRVYWHDGGNDLFSAQWADYSDQGDVIFTAGADSREGDAFEAMAVMASYLYGYEP